METKKKKTKRRTIDRELDTRKSKRCGDVRDLGICETDGAERTI